MLNDNVVGENDRMRYVNNNSAARQQLDLQQLTADDWPLWRTMRLQALREAPYAFGSRLADWQGKGDLEERWRARLSSVPFNLIAVLNGGPVGMPLSGSAGYSSAQLIFPVAAAIDGSHNVWVANQSSTTVTKVAPDGSQFTSYSAAVGRRDWRSISSATSGSPTTTATASAKYQPPALTSPMGPTPAEALTIPRASQSMAPATFGSRTTGVRP